MTGILCLFTESYNVGARESEKFVNPNVTSIDITIDGTNFIQKEWYQQTFGNQLRGVILQELLIKTNTGGSVNLSCYMFVVADVLMEMLGGSLKSILY